MPALHSVRRIVPDGELTTLGHPTAAWSRAVVEADAGGIAIPHPQRVAHEAPGHPPPLARGKECSA